jgi:hypothetical protein
MTLKLEPAPSLKVISRFQRFEFRNALLPGPLAQAITFRAFGAANQSLTAIAALLLQKQLRNLVRLNGGRAFGPEPS